MTIEDVAAKYNLSYSGNIYKNDDGSERIGCLHLTDDKVNKKGEKRYWVIPFEEGLDLILNKGASIFFDPFEEELIAFLKQYLIRNGVSKDRIYGGP